MADPPEDPQVHHEPSPTDPPARRSKSAARTEMLRVKVSKHIEALERAAQAAGISLDEPCAERPDDERE
jgi:hypothetical protein